MSVDNSELKKALSKKLDEIGVKVETMKSRVKEDDPDIASDTRELDSLVRELKALQGLSAFDKTAYQREYMRKKRSENPDYRPIIKHVKDLPEWRKSPEDLE
jgi:SMC interacting uncharacterized protein involved in chromosome segregation